MYGLFAFLSLAVVSAAQEINVYNAKDDGLSQHTIYMPENATGKIPVMVWGSGACARDGKQ